MSQVQKIQKRRLYKLAQQLQVMKPWEDFAKIGILAITLANRKTPFYTVFLENTIVICPNQAALKGLFYLSEQDTMPEIQRMRYQQHFICYFVDEAEFSQLSHDSLDDLSIEPIDQQLPVFESVMPGVLPDELIYQEVQTMIDLLKQLVESVQDMHAIEALNHSIEHHIVHRYFDFEQKKWTFELLDMVDDALDVKPLNLSQSQHEQLQSQSLSEQVLELDVAYTAMMVDKKEGHRQGVIRVLLLADHQKRTIVSQKLITLKDDANRMLVDHLIENISQQGIPKQLIVRDTIVMQLLQHVIEDTNMQVIVKQNLETIDLYVDELSQQAI